MSLFKVLMVLAFICTISVAEENSSETRAETRAAEAKCLKNLGYSKYDYRMELWEKGRMVDMNVKCATKCILKELKCLKADDTFDLQVMAKNIYWDDEMLKNKIITGCIEQEMEQNTTDCDKFHNVVVCMLQKTNGTDVEENNL